MKRLLPYVVATAITAVSAHFAGPSAVSEEHVSREYQLKAAYLHKFLGFTEWKAESKATEVRRLCILGANPFGDVIQKIIEQQDPGDRNVTVSLHRVAHDLRACHLLFISPSEAGRLQQILESVKGSGVVTTSDIPGFASSGGVIELFIEGRNVRFKINLAKAKSEEIEFEAQLLALAKVVQPSP